MAQDVQELVVAVFRRQLYVCASGSDFVCVCLKFRRKFRVILQEGYCVTTGKQSKMRFPVEYVENIFSPFNHSLMGLYL